MSSATSFWAYLVSVVVFLVLYFSVLPRVLRLSVTPHFTMAYLETTFFGLLSITLLGYATVILFTRDDGLASSKVWAGVAALCTIANVLRTWGDIQRTHTEQVMDDWAPMP